MNVQLVSVMDESFALVAELELAARPHTQDVIYTAGRMYVVLGVVLLDRPEGTRILATVGQVTEEDAAILRAILAVT